MVKQFLKLSLTICGALALPMGPATAQQTGGILKFFHRDSPASMSIHEEGTNSVSIPMMAVFNNLVLYDHHVAQNSLNPKSGSWMIARWHRIGGNQRDGDRNDGSGSSPEG